MDCGVDRISDLPIDIINKIQVCMPLHDAVRTSILSWEWRYHWVTMPHLVFDKNMRGNHEFIVDRTLLLHKGTITKFSIMKCLIRSSLAFIRWLFVLSDHRIDTLVLVFPILNYIQPIKIHLISFDHLKHLHIEDECQIELSPLFRGFKSLVRLEIINVNIKLQNLEVLLAKCPVINYLKLRFSVDHIHGTMEELPNKLNSLTVLQLGELDFQCLESVKVLMSLIKSFPNLQSLKIGSISNVHANRVTNYLKQQRTLNVPLKCLEYVKIRIMMNYAADVEFVKNLLMWTTVLKKVELDCFIGYRNLDVRGMLEEIASFQRAFSSSRAQIIVDNGRNWFEFWKD
ncbi:F-box/FBD/LRR-repeat protein At1g13570-like [Andrographis paniculata]|uniref:F-box/FBD/LRR-repeat protein At1g13570-like n=1 Tax=Andrographis paniculata TaxID=175694 RepID=UPI0021E8CA29|nr:F-box/FBD/LRR-repeat protein At1g13570-like [Andrographis paniculata]